MSCFFELEVSLTSIHTVKASMCKCVLFVSSVSSTDADKKKRQKEKEAQEANIVLPIRLATLKVRLKTNF